MSEIYVIRRVLFRDDGDGIDEVEVGMKYGEFGIFFLEVEFLFCRSDCEIWYMVG